MTKGSPCAPPTLQRCVELKDLAGSIAASVTMAKAAGGGAEIDAASRHLDSALHALREAQTQLDACVDAMQREQIAALDGAREALRIHIGPGERQTAGWVNVDLMQGQVIADLRRPLPFADDSASHMYCSHVLEHLRNPDESHAFLKECRRVLRRGGKLRVVVPDIAVYLRACLDDDATFWVTHQKTWPWSRVEANRLDQTLRYAGAGSNPGDFFGHQHGYDARSLVRVLHEAGFAPVKLSGYQQSSDDSFRIDDQSSVAHVEHEGQALSLFAEAWSIF